MFKGAIFDFDGVIVNSEPGVIRTWQKVLSDHGIKIDLKNWAKNHGGRPSFDIMNQYLGDRFDQKHIQKLVKYKQSLSLQELKDDFQPVAGIVEFVKFLKNKKIKIAIASSSFPEKIEYGLNSLGIVRFIDAIVTHRDISHPKPHPEIFLTAIKKLKIHPSQSLIFEDSHSGLTAARNAGGKVVLVTTSHQPKEFPKNYLHAYIKDFNEARSKLFRD
jgi:beta-phosphoglucomutase